MLRISKAVVRLALHHELPPTMLAASIMLELTMLVVMAGGPAWRELQSPATDQLLAAVRPYQIELLVLIAVLVVSMLATSVKLTALRPALLLAWLRGIVLVGRSNYTAYVLLAGVLTATVLSELQQLDRSYATSCYYGGPTASFGFLVAAAKFVGSAAVLLPIARPVQLGIAGFAALIWLAARIRYPLYNKLPQLMELVAAGMCIVMATIGLLLNFLPAGALHTSKLLVAGCLLICLLAVILFQEKKGPVYLTYAIMRERLIETLLQLKRGIFGSNLQYYCSHLLDYHREAEGFEGLLAPRLPVTLLNKKYWMLFVYELVIRREEYADPELSLTSACVEFDIKANYHESRFLLEHFQKSIERQRFGRLSWSSELFYYIRVQLMKEEMRRELAERRFITITPFEYLHLADAIVRDTFEISSLYTKLWRQLADRDGFFDSVLDLSEQISRCLESLERKLKAMNFRSRQLAECLSYFERFVRVDKHRSSLCLRDYDNSILQELLTNLYNIVPLSLSFYRNDHGRILNCGLNSHLIGMAYLPAYERHVEMMMPSMYRSTHNKKMYDQLNGDQPPDNRFINKTTFAVVDSVLRLVESYFRLNVVNDALTLVGFIKVCSRSDEMLLLVDCETGSVIAASEKRDVIGADIKPENWRDITYLVPKLPHPSKIDTGFTQNVPASYFVCEFTFSCLKRIPTNESSYLLLLQILVTERNFGGYNYNGSSLNLKQRRIVSEVGDKFVEVREPVRSVSHQRNPIGVLLVVTAVIALLMKLASIVYCSINTATMMSYMEIAGKESIIEWSITRAYVYMQYLRLSGPEELMPSELQASKASLRQLVEMLSYQSSNDTATRSAGVLSDVFFESYTVLYQADQVLVLEQALSNFKVMTGPNDLQATNDSLTWLDHNRRFVMSASKAYSLSRFLLERVSAVNLYLIVRYAIAGGFLLTCLLYLIGTCIIVRKRESLRKKVLEAFNELTSDELSHLQTQLNRYMQMTAALNRPLVLPILVCQVEEVDNPLSPAQPFSPHYLTCHGLTPNKQGPLHLRERFNWPIYLLLGLIIVLALSTEGYRLYLYYSSKQAFNSIQLLYPKLKPNAICLSTIVYRFFDDVVEEYHDPNWQLQSAITLCQAVRVDLAVLQYATAAQPELAPFRKLIGYLLYNNLTEYVNDNTYQQMTSMSLDNVLGKLYSDMRYSYSSTTVATKFLVYVHWLERIVQGLFAEVNTAYVKGSTSYLQRQKLEANWFNVATALLALITLGVMIGVVIAYKSAVRGLVQAVELIRGTYE